MIKTLFIAFAFFLLDQFSKWLVLVPMNLEMNRVIEVFPPYLVFQMAWNDGINFGLFGGDSEVMRGALILLAIGISIWLLMWSRAYQGWLAALFVGLTVGGAIGNALDRVLYGAVVDFLNMSCCGVNNPYVFNLADVFVFVGIFGIILFSDRFQKKA